MLARHIPDRFFRQITGPDYQVLREREVSPQHHQGQRQISQIVKMPRLQHPIHRFTLRQPRHRQDREPQSAQRPRRHEDQTEDRRRPCGVERHHPINRRERRRQNEDYQTWPA